MRAHCDGVELWIGVVNVAPNHDSTQLGTAKGAFVRVISPATSDIHFRELVHKELADYDFSVVSYCDVELFKEFTARHTVTADLQELADKALDRKSPVLSTFHAYPSDEDMN